MRDSERESFVFGLIGGFWLYFLGVFSGWYIGMMAMVAHLFAFYIYRENVNRCKEGFAEPEKKTKARSRKKR